MEQNREILPNLDVETLQAAKTLTLTKILKVLVSILWKEISLAQKQFLQLVF